MNDKTPRVPISDQFRKSAEALAQNMSLVMQLRDARDEAEIMVGKLEGLLLGAKAELQVRQRAYEEGREISSPQSKFFLSVMETEANDNVALLREARESAS